MVLISGQDFELRVLQLFGLLQVLNLFEATIELQIEVIRLYQVTHYSFSVLLGLLELLLEPLVVHKILVILLLELLNLRSNPLGAEASPLELSASGSCWALLVCYSQLW